jgi:subtilisin family serine protease
MFLKGKKYGKLWIGAVILAILVILSSMYVLLPAEASIGKEGQIIKVGESDYKELSKVEGFGENISIANYSRVVLITGDVVHLYTLSDGSSRVAIEPADPSNTNRAFRVFEDMDGLYVIPNDVSLDKFDVELFNVKLLARQMKLTGLNDTLRAIVKPVRGVTLEQFINSVSSIGKEVKAEHYAKTIHKGLNLASLSIDVRQPEKVKVLLDKVMTKIERVWLDRVHKIDVSQFRPMLDVSVPQVGADWVWVNSMMSGEGVKIAILDTGIDFSHRDFTYFNGTSKIIAAESFVDWPEEEIGDPWDHNGHGTHVSGIAAGTGLTEFADPETLSPIAHPLIKRPMVHGGWNDEGAIIAGNGSHLVVVWHSDITGNWEIWYTVYDGVSWSLPTKLTEDLAQDKWPYVVLLSNNRILVAWTSDRTGRWEIWYKTYINGGWTEDKQLTTDFDDYDYSPAFAELDDGTIAMIWSSEVIDTNTTNVWFARLNIQPDGTLEFIDGSTRQLTNAEPNMWLFANSILVTSEGLWAFWTDLSHYDFSTHWGGITTMYYNFSADFGESWSGSVLYSCSGCVGPYGIQLSNGTIVVFYHQDDFEHNVPDTIYYLRLGDSGWEGPFWLPSDVWHRWKPSAAYGPGGLYVAFTSPGRPWEYYGNDIYITTPKPRYMGVAPKANLLEGKVLNRWGWGYSSWIIAGIEWAVENGADIISMSLGGGPTDGTDPLSQAVDWAFDQGVLVVVAAGNEGQYFGITTPGAARKALTVGAVDDYDEIAWFSSRGPTLDYRVKPEIVAPGVDVCSSVPGYLFGEYYQCWSGTSMATPHVAGAAALAKQFSRVYFSYDVPSEVLKDVLIVVATEDLGYNVYEQGAGRLNIAKLIAESSIFGYGGGWIYPAVINFGLVDRGEEVSAEIFIEELEAFGRSRTYSFELEVLDILTGEYRDIAQLSTTYLEISPGERRSIRLTISPDAPVGLYSGKIKIIDNYGQTYNVIFGVTILNKLTIYKIPWEGPGEEWAVAGDLVEVTILDPDSEEELQAGCQWGWFNEEGYAYFYLPEGTYEVYTIGEYNYKPVFLAYDNLEFTSSRELTLDERSSYEVVFDPAKAGQVFAEIYHGMKSGWICPPTVYYCYRIGIDWLGYYPRETSVYYSYSYNLWSLDRYVYYPIEDANPSNPSIISTDLWHDLVYVEKEIDSPINRMADYSKLVAKYTEYRTMSTSRQSAERESFAYRNVPTWATFNWLINIPYSRLEIVSPETRYSGFYKKWADLPGSSTPYWEYYGWFWTGGAGELRDEGGLGRAAAIPNCQLYLFNRCR